MLKRKSPYVQDETAIYDSWLAHWAWDSHNWVEHMAGYYKCSDCDMNHTGAMGINKHFPLCKSNPAIIHMTEMIEQKMLSSG